MPRHILITGASTGLGAAMAAVLAPGNKIIVHYNTSEEKAKTTAKKVETATGVPFLAKADLSSEAGCQRLFEQVAARFDKLDLLVNNAGSLVKRQHVHEIEWQNMVQTFSLNVFSVIKLTSLCLPLLEKGSDPCIINITSIAQRHGAPSATLYGAAKAAIDSFTRGLAKEVAPKIRVNSVAPGVILTPFHEKFSDAQRMENFREATPLKRNGEPEHIAHTVKFLMENDFITGESIDVNGGLFMR
jgi:3-oxoacyl-[acyl-carrier protein] reductase